jgi:N6-adenosine-specific RNA methylase IME4
MRIDPEFQALIAPLQQEERDQLEANLVAHGCRDPLALWRDILIDGHNRYEICARLKIRYRTVDVPLASREHALLWIEENQLGRRNLKEWQRAAITHSILERRSALERQERARKGRARGGDATPEQKQRRLSETSSDKRSDKKKDSRAAVSKQARVSEWKLRQIGEIKKKKPEAIAAIRTGEKTGNEVIAEIRNAEKQKVRERIEAEAPQYPDGPFRVLVVDPPWKYGARSEDPTHRAANPYPDMDIDEIRGLPVAKLAHPDCVLWLWTTNAFLRDAFTCLDAWGFQQKTILTWVKDRMGLGDWLRGMTEHCLLAIKGRPLVTLTNQTTALTAPRGKHSAKPEEFYVLVESLCPGAKLEMFAREKRKGWEAWGAEADK